jgi:calcium-dependent protein kinase
MELCEGGELFERLVEKEFFDENEAKHIFTQIVQAVSYCHSHGVCHRDLKPENFLLLDSSEDSPVKVIDFGFSALFEKKSSLPKKDLKTKVGTPYYVSP